MSEITRLLTSLKRRSPKNCIKIRQIVLIRTKEADGLIVRLKRACRIFFVIIFRGTEVEPNKRLAPSKERVTDLESVGEEK